MGKHTPGPWINGGEGRSIGRNEEMTFIFAATQENVTKREQRANVRLACAAPDLLEALEGLVGWFGEVDYGNYESGEVDESRLDWLGLYKLLDKAEAAIAKAKEVRNG